MEQSVLVSEGTRPRVRPQITDRHTRWAVSATFFLNAVITATWVARIPAIQQRLGVDTGIFGVALLGAAIGSLIAMPLMGGFIARRGSRAATRLTLLATCATLPLLAVAPHWLALMGALMLFGASFGSLDVAMNSQATTVEARYHRPIMSSFHGLWSAGGLLGAALGGVIAAHNVPLLIHFASAALVVGVLAVIVTHWLLPAGVDAASEGPSFARPTRALLGLGLIALCALLAEGAMADWSALYLRRTIGTGPGLAAAGYAAFSLLMAVGRLSGDWLTQRLGPVVMVRSGGVLVALGLLIALVIQQPVAAIIGFGCVGAGLATLFPLVLSSAARTTNTAPGPAIAAMSTAGYTGFLVGPPLIGFAAQLMTLRGALVLVLLLGFVIAAMAPAVNARRTATSE